MRNKYVTELREVQKDNGWIFLRTTSDALKGAMRWIDNNVRKE